MLNDWTHWLSSMPYDLLLQILLPLAFFDSVRYAIGAVAIFVVDFCREAKRLVWPEPPAAPYPYCPSVCVLIAGHNEAATIRHTLHSIWDSYPRLSIVVVDDGSIDGMSEAVREFARGKAHVTLLTRSRRGGKSSALNFALPFIHSDVVVCVDGDSHLEENAIWEVVQPFADPEVGAVSGCVVARNPFAKVVTWMQAFEYLQNIFVGRMIVSRLGLLRIISGAFGAVRRDALTRLQGWDVGPGEDGDLSLRLRKSGYRIAFAPYAQCFTNVPESWWRLIKQRRRWEWAVVTHDCRKHVDMANLLSRNFRLSNLCVLADHWIFDIGLTYVSFGYLLWLSCHRHEDLWKIFFLYFLVYAGMQLIQAAVFLFYSTNRRRDTRISLMAPLMPLYHGLLRCVTLWSLTEEFLFRRSFRDNFVPIHVREVTWHW